MWFLDVVVISPEFLWYIHIPIWYQADLFSRTIKVYTHSMSEHCTIHFPKLFKKKKKKGLTIYQLERWGKTNWTTDTGLISMIYESPDESVQKSGQCPLEKEGRTWLSNSPKNKKKKYKLPIKIVNDNPSVIKINWFFSCISLVGKDQNWWYPLHYWLRYKVTSFTLLVEV